MAVQYFETEGGKLAVETSGQGPLVLCSPAMGDLRNAYSPLRDQLVTKGYTVACIDLRGHGDSSTGFTRYGDEAVADDFLMLIEALNKGPAVLVGASLSAAGATIAAAQRPELVKGVVLIGPFLRNPMGSFGKYFMAAMVSRPWGPMLWKMYSKMLWPGLGAEGGAKRATECMDSITRAGRWSAFQATVAGADHSVVAPWLEKVKDVPALVVIGEKDPDWSKPVDEAKWVASNFSNSKLVTVPDAGHAPQLERPELVGKAVIDFLASVKL
jgi:pimeloyl-ACP methyl ester carboxylesterase